MMDLTRFANVLGAAVDDAFLDLRRALRRLRPNRNDVVDHAERCHGTTKSGARCKRNPVPGSKYCFQHRQDKGMLLVVDMRDKAAKTTTEISQKAKAAVVGGASQLVPSSPNLGARVRREKWISRMRRSAKGFLESIDPRNGRGASGDSATQYGELGPNLRVLVSGSRGVSGARYNARRILGSLGAERRWLVAAVMVVAVAAILYLIVSLADLNPLIAFAREIVSRTTEVSTASIQDPQAPGEQPVEGGGPLSTFGEEVAGPPGTDFRGAYVSNVEHLSNESSMLEIFVPAGVEGEYHATVTGSEGLEFECVILHHYSDRLYCIGARLLDGSQVNVKIFWISALDGSQMLVFETNYTTGEVVLPPPIPTQPSIVPYGGGFTWPDRFDGIQQRREQESTRALWPLSAISGLAALWLITRTGHSRLLLGRREPQPVRSP